MDEGLFIRELELDNTDESLLLYQKEVGDVSCVVWDAALVLAKYLEIRCNNKAEWLRSKSVIELGGGLGCVGLTAAFLGANVTITDLPEVMPLLQKNIAENEVVWSSRGGTATTQVLQWGSDLTKWKIPDLVLLADCVYYEESVEPLIETLRGLTDSSTEVLLSQEERDTEKQQTVWKMFQNQLGSYFHVTRVPEEEQHPEYRSSDIVVLRLQRI